MVRVFEPVAADTLGERLGQLIELPCVVTSVARQISKSNKEWGKILVEDFTGTATVLAFGDKWQDFKESLETDAVVLIAARVSDRVGDEEDPPLFLEGVRLLDDVQESGELAIQIELSLESKAADEHFSKARELLVEHPGSSPVWLQVGTDNGEPAPKLRSRSLKAAPDRETVEGLQKIFGPGNVRLVRAFAPAIDTSASDRRAMWANKNRE